MNSVLADQDGVSSLSWKLLASFVGKDMERLKRMYAKNVTFAFGFEMK